MKEVSDVLFRYAGPCDSAEEMYTRARNYLKRTRAVAHEYVCLPEDETCLCVPLPPCYKDSYPWGGYEGGDFRVKPLRGQMFLNQYNYQNITDGWIKMNTMHETYPGHHVQFIRAAIDPTPETVKIGAKVYLWKREPVFGLNAHLPLSLRKTRSSLCSLHSAVIMPLSVSWLICSCIILERHWKML